MTTQEEIRNAWNKFAAGYDDYVTPFSTRFAEDALRLIELRPGMRFLDVACGTGALSIPAARLGAQVVAVDLASAMVERLNTRARQEGLANLEAHVMDGLALDLEDGSFDIAGSQFGVMLFPDRQRGLAELARVTQPGGHVLMTVFGSFQKIEIFSFFMGAAQAAIPGFTPPEDFPIFRALYSSEQLRQGLSDAGLKSIRVETVTHGMEFRSSADLWTTLTVATPPVAMLVNNLTDEQRNAVRQALDGMLSERAKGQPTAVLNMEAVIGIGTK